MAGNKRTPRNTPDTVVYMDKYILEHQLSITPHQQRILGEFRAHNANRQQEEQLALFYHRLGNVVARNAVKGPEEFDSLDYGKLF